MENYIKKANKTDIKLIQNMYNLYLYDKNQYTREYDNLCENTFFDCDKKIVQTGRDREFYTIQANDKVIGFLIINKSKGRKKYQVEIVDLFIMNVMRKKDYGTIALNEIVSKYPGDYTVKIEGANSVALRFIENFIESKNMLAHISSCMDGRELYSFTAN